MKTYKGYDIHPASPNASGIKYYCRVQEADIYNQIPSRTLKADTLQGIKYLINQRIEKLKKYI